MKYLEVQMRRAIFNLLEIAKTTPIGLVFKLVLHWTDKISWNDRNISLFILNLRK